MKNTCLNIQQIGIVDVTSICKAIACRVAEQNMHEN